MPQLETSGARRLLGRDGPESATPRDLQAARLAAGQHGMLTTSDLASCGISGRMVTVRVSRGQLHPVFRGVYCVGHDALTRSALFCAAVLACGTGAVLSHYSAAAHLGLLPWRGDRRPEVIVRGSAGRKIDGIAARRSRLDPYDTWTRDAIRVTTPARTILDVAATRPFTPLRRMIRQAMAERKVNVRQLLDVLRRHPRHRGAVNLRAVVANGPVPTKSDLEDLGLDLLDSAGITRPEVNPKLLLDGRAIHPDLLFRDQRLAIELDSRRWHDDPLTQQDDADKQAILEAHGYRVLRITWWQIVDHPEQTLRRIRAALAGG